MGAVHIEDRNGALKVVEGGDHLGFRLHIDEAAPKSNARRFRQRFDGQS